MEKCRLHHKKDDWRSESCAQSTPLWRRFRRLKLESACNHTGESTGGVAYTLYYVFSCVWSGPYIHLLRESGVPCVTSSCMAWSSCSLQIDNWGRISTRFTLYIIKEFITAMPVQRCRERSGGDWWYWVPGPSQLLKVYIFWTCVTLRVLEEHLIYH